MRFPLSDALSVMLPSPEQTLFLRACVQEGAALHEAWSAWLGVVGEPLRYLRASGRDLRAHLPLLYRNLTRHGASSPPGLQPYLRAAEARERLRFATWEECFRETTAVLAAAGIDFTILKGAALARTVYEPPFRRHCHDLDLWVRDEELPRAIDALAAHGFRCGGRRGETTPLEHPRGLPVLLHARLLAGPYAVPEEELRARRRRAGAAGDACAVLAPPDMLLHVCAHAAGAGRRPHASWVVDAHLLSARLCREDWDTFRDVARRAGLALPLTVLLRYLRDEVAAPVPAAVLDGLAADATRADGAHLLAAIDGAWLGRPGGLGRMLGRSGWRSRLVVSRWLLLPPARYLRATRGAMGPARLAAEYAIRPWRFLRRAALGRWRRVATSGAGTAAGRLAGQPRGSSS